MGGMRRTHLQQLEAEAIHVMREVVAQFERPVMLYSIGKDSSVLLHLARKAFHPGRIPFPLLHVDTTWKFREMIEFRDRTAAELDLDLAASWAYSDSGTDLPMLDAVGHPVAVNPETRLAGIARKRGWLVEDFRKSPGMHRSPLPLAPTLHSGTSR